MLLLRLRRRSVLAIGRLGDRVFAAGTYAYVGSARGPGGLAARLRHHLGPSPHPHWHIDYLKTRAVVVEVWAAAHPRRQECRWAGILARMSGGNSPVPGFGASDCACTSHLFHFTAMPRLADFNRRLAEIGGGGPAVRFSPVPKTKRGGIGNPADTAP